MVTFNSPSLQIDSMTSIPHEWHTASPFFRVLDAQQPSDDAWHVGMFSTGRSLFRPLPQYWPSPMLVIVAGMIKLYQTLKTTRTSQFAGALVTVMGCSIWPRSARREPRCTACGSVSCHGFCAPSRNELVGGHLAGNYQAISDPRTRNEQPMMQLMNDKAEIQPTKTTKNFLHQQTNQPDGQSPSQPTNHFWHTYLNHRKSTPGCGRHHVQGASSLLSSDCRWPGFHFLPVAPEGCERQ